FVVVISATSLACWRAYRKGAAIEKRFWLLLVSINVLTIASQIIGAALMFTTAGAGPQMPSLADFLNLIAAVCFGALVLSGISSRVRHSAVIFRHALDATAIAVILYVFVALMYVGPLFGPVALGDVASIATGSAYPLLGLFILVGTFVGILSPRAGLWLLWERLVAASLALYATGLLFWPVLRVTSDYVSLNVSAVLYAEVFLVGHYLMFAAAISRLAYGQVWTIAQPLPVRSELHRFLALVMPFSVIFAAAGFGYIAAVGASTEAGTFIAAVCAAILMVLLAVRSSMLVSENASLRKLSVSDPLTGLMDRKQFLATIAAQVDAAQRFGDPVAVVVLDLDGFASINSRLGSRIADTLLCDVSSTVTRITRPGDSVFRSGDDEFALVLPDCTAPQAMRVAEEVRVGISAIETSCRSRLSASIGLAVYPEDALDHKELLRRAQGAAYHAKTHGKDQVIRFDVTRGFDLGPKERAERLHAESRLSTVRGLAAAVDARDATKQFHSRNVARLCVLLAQELRMSQVRIDLLETAALLHDIGKIGVSEAILRKAGRLSASERLEVQKHSALGERILAGANMTEILPWVLCHH
ncbi:MAG: diguanylate cyclase, partial [Coriobacteriia bacterium]|nr:diguanylate cyclase [Coriobacteriia bacterium]